jgi:hypothetical protein
MYPKEGMKSDIIIQKKTINENFSANAAYYPHCEQQRPGAHGGGHRPMSIGGEVVLG